MRRVAAIVFLASFSILFAQDKSPHLPDAAPADVGLDAARLKDIDTAIADAIKAKQCPGAVVLVLRQGKVAFRKAYGQRAVEPKAEAMTTDTIFDLASLTKPMATAAAIHHLAQQKKLKLDDLVSKHLPAFKHDKITLEHLLLHTSGLPAGNPVSAYIDGKEKAIQKIAELRLLANPGKRFTYSDLGYILLGAIVEKVSGETLDTYTRKHIFTPLGLSTLTFRPGKDLISRCAPTEKEKDIWLRGVVHDPRSRVLGGVAGHAGLFGTADDLAIYAQMLLDEGAFRKKRIFDAATVKQFTTAREVPKGKRTLGWDAKTSYSSNRGEHFGGYGHTGFTGTSMWIDPASKTAVIVLSNRVHPNGKGNVVKLRAQVATIVAKAIIKPPLPNGCDTMSSQ